MQPYIGAESALDADSGEDSYSSWGFTRTDVLCLGIIAAAFVATLLLIPPQHEYPIIDDWIYAGSVRTMQQTGVFTVGDSQANLFGLAIWGLLWSNLFHFSFTTLTYSTLVMSLACLFAFYGIARAVRVPPGGALLGTGLLGFNTIFLHLSYSFMTDVPFLALTLLACYCYVRGLQSENLTWFVFGSLFAGWSFLIRQFGGLVAIVFLLYLVADALITRKARWREMLIIIVIPAAFLLGWRLWLPMTSTSGIALGAAQRSAAIVGKDVWPHVILFRFLAVLPLTALFAVSAVKLKRTRWWLAPVLGIAVVFAIYAIILPNRGWIEIPDPTPVIQLGSLSFPMPQEIFLFDAIGNIVRIDGIDFFQYPQQPVWPTAVWWLIWLLGLGLGVVILSKIAGSLWDWLKSLRRPSLTPLAPVYLTGAAIFAISIAFPGDLFDRYILGFIPFLILFMVRGSRAWSRRAWVFSIVALAVLASFTLLAKADQMGHDNARWQAGQWLSSKVGGAVHVGYDYNYWAGPSSDQYQVADLPLEGFTVAKDFPYFSWLTFSRRTVLALAGNGAPPVSP